MNERKPVKSLMDLKMTNWYMSRPPMIQEAICKYPPGYYVYSENGETYKLIGWSNPEEDKEEIEVHVYLERDIRGGTERLRIHPNYMSPEEELIELNRLQEELPPHINNIVMGYNVGRSINGEMKYLNDPSTNTRRCFSDVVSAQNFLLISSIATAEQLHKFIYEPVFS